MKAAFTRAVVIVAGAGVVAALAPIAMAEAAPALTAGASTPDRGPTNDCSWAGTAGISLEQAFARSAQSSGVPVSVLKALSYLESRWDDHAGAASADGGYGPMNLTDLAVADNTTGKGDGTVRTAESTRTAALGARLTGQSLAAVKNNPNANVCAGAAVLASYRSGSAPRTDVNTWTSAVSRFGAAGSGQSSQEFAAQVFTVLRSGAARVTTNGQRVTMAAQPSARVPAAASAKTPTDCPQTLNCEWIAAPYLKSDPSLPDNTGSYGNHDLGDRVETGPELDYIVIHDTEGSYDGSVGLVQDPTYLAWNYTIRSNDGHVAQHLNPKDVGWHAGNWYINMHSIGIEHEGKAGNAGWYTEAMYTNSAKLVKYLANEHDIPLDPAHIIGHDQVPGTVKGATQSVHWDPGPYWDWEHYFDLLGAPLGGKKATTTGAVAVGDVVTVLPGYAGNTHLLTRCEQESPGSGACQAAAPTNFSLLYQQPSLTSPLAKDVAVHPSGDAAGTDNVRDVTARAQAGNKLVVAALQGDWVKVSWAGEFAWINNPVSHRVLVKTPTATVSVKAGATSAPVYGRAYPEQAAYPASVPYLTVIPVELTLKPGQSYAVTDDSVKTDYWNNHTYDGSGPGDRVAVLGQDAYLQIAIAHRVFYVKAADVQLTAVTKLVNVTKPTIYGTAKVGRTLTALTGQWTGGVTKVAFQWLRDGHKMAGATDQAYTVRKADARHLLSVQVTASAPNADHVSASSTAVKATN